MLAACSNEQAGAPASPPQVAFVQMFEWHWNDIARECEEHLGPAGYTAIQTSPPHEHITGPAWWTRYQVVSYQVESRSGTRQEFADMVKRCKAAGIDIYADAIINHMAGFPEGVGVAGSAFREYEYPVPYDYEDFHHCGVNEDDRITDYQQQFEVQNCQLGTLDDLATGKPEVQAKIAAYLNDLLSLGVAGFRLDAVKHIQHDEVGQILTLVQGEPLVFQEVIDFGSEPIKAKHYLGNGMVTEFQYAAALIDAFGNGNLEALADLGADSDWLPSDQAIVFVDNHDTQRSHIGDEILNYREGARYELAVAFMLAYPYGYPMVMSSYAFEDDDQGPPASSPHDDIGCGTEWVCEHRRPAIADMVAFRKAVAGTAVNNWRIDDKVISFGRGDKGHVVFNTGDAATSMELASNLPDGSYDAASVADGTLSVTVPALSATAIRN
jgi:alpha-amylase